MARIIRSRRKPRNFRTNARQALLRYVIGIRAPHESRGAEED
jgi:hypothetical protein